MRKDTSVTSTRCDQNSKVFMIAAYKILRSTKIADSTIFFTFISEYSRLVRSIYSFRFEFCILIIFIRKLKFKSNSKFELRYLEEVAAQEGALSTDFQTAIEFFSVYTRYTTCSDCDFSDGSQPETAPPETNPDGG